MQKNRLDQDLPEDGSKDFANIGNLNERNDTFSVEGSPRFSSQVMERFWMMHARSFGSLGLSQNRLKRFF